MYFSKKLSLLFVACPKTGSSSVEAYLMKIDPSGEMFSLTLNDKKITSKDMHYGVVGHAYAWELKQALGDEIYNSLHVIGMVRHPYDKLISSYYFAKSQSILKVLKWRGEKNLLKRKIKGLISHTAPKILPISLWVLLYPMKTSYQYFFDKKSNRIVKYLGRTDNLNEDLRVILKTIGINQNLEIPHQNKSNHKSRDHYFKNGWIKNHLLKKYAKDIELYKIADNEMKELHKKKAEVNEE